MLLAGCWLMVPIAIIADTLTSHQAVVMDMVGRLGFAQLRISTREPIDS